ncbi:MAG TPA: ATPase domain-containing protein, partial [Thermoplasmata archaeon]
MRIRTGVDGFDSLVDGGLPGGASVVLQGPSGNEKDAFALQFLAEGIRAGEAVAIVVSSTSPEEFLASLGKVGVDVQQAFKANRLRVVDWHSFQEKTVVGVEDRGHVLRCSGDLTNVGVALERSLSALPQDLAKRAVVEILSRALKIFDVDHVYAFAQSSKAKLARHKVTSLFLLEKEMHDRETLSSVSQPFDGVIDLDRGREGNAITRTIGVLSMKDTVPDTRFHPCDIVAGKGLVVQVAPAPEAVPHPTHEVSGPGGAIHVPRGASLILRIAEERIRVDPRDPDALFAKASALAAMGDAASAIAALDSLIEVDDRYPGLWVLRVKLFVRMGDKKGAQESRRRAEGIMIREEQRAKSGEKLVCPRCQSIVPTDLRECPSCGARLLAKAGATEELDSAGKAAIQDRVRRELDVESPTYKVRDRKVVAAPRERVVKPRAPVPGVAPKAPGGQRGPIGRTNGLRGRTNGLTNGLQGRTNGLTNGLRGRTKLANGLVNGLVNGMRVVPIGRTNGLTNGAGFTNGLGSHRFAHESRHALWKLYLIPVLATILLLAPLLTIVPNTPSGPTVDGDFSDWEGVASHALSTGAANADVDLTRVAVRAGVDYVSLLIEVRGLVLAGGPDPPGLMDGIYVFVDLDGASTGYPIHGLGADHLIEVQGAAGRVHRSVVYRASPSVGDPRDWNTWTDAVSIPAAAAESRLEIAVYWADLGDGDDAPVFLIASMGHEGTTDVADLRVGTTAGHLRVLQRHVTFPVLSGPSAPLLAVELTALDTPATVSGLTVELLGTAPFSAITSVRLLDSTGNPLAERTAVGPSVSFAFAAITLPPGQFTTWLVSASVSGSSGGTLGARIPSPEAVSAGVAIVTLQTVGGDEPLGYVGVVPAVPLIDGAFAEWSGEFADAVGEPGTGGNPSVDVAGFGAIVGATNLTFHVRLQGPAFAGTVLTAERGKVPVVATPSADRDRDTVPDSLDPLPD